MTPTEAFRKAVLKHVLTWFRSAQARQIMRREIYDCTADEDPFHVGGCLTWATAVAKALGSGAKVYTLVARVRNLDPKKRMEEYGHAVVRFRGAWHDSSGSYLSSEDLLRSHQWTGVSLKERRAFLKAHPYGENLYLHGTVVKELLATYRRVA